MITHVGRANKSARLPFMTVTSDRPASRLDNIPTWLIGQASAHAHRLLTDRLAAADARGYHYRLLSALDESGPASQAALGRRTGIDRSDVVAALNELSNDGYIRRSPDPNDRRRNVVTITSSGERRLAALDAVLAAVQDELLASLSSAERAVFVGLLARIVRTAPER